MFCDSNNILFLYIEFLENLREFKILYIYIVDFKNCLKFYVVKVFKCLKCFVDFCVVFLGCNEWRVVSYFEKFI